MCLLPIVALCLFQPSELTIEADASWSLGRSYYYVADRPYEGSIGRISLTMPVVVSERLQFHYGLEHRSMIETDADRGEERAVLGFTWRPFAR
jgi:hypothetical protein